MTYGEVFTQILLEAGVAREMTSAILKHVKAIEPGTNIDRELSPAEADALLNKLRQEKEGIRAWLLRCKFLVTPPEGSA